ncbi:hypothetical protein L1987_16435 [Smallanthus sonchifolius]|uniref:Uncharacterized protein n=1 Tax=Smallanthus sonchifolius TaxID=185202 RepID=A0ACB9JAG7_9ASTR|nr:hypothetical protein L1987_16435 [Smallanthus sonchifolius]
MVVAQKLKESEIAEQDSLLLISTEALEAKCGSITLLFFYIRGLFPEKYFRDKGVPALEGPMIEEYAYKYSPAVSFSYSNSESQEVSMNVNRIGNKKQGETFKCNSTTEITPTQMNLLIQHFYLTSSACKMVRTLVQLMRTLDKMPEERTILMKLLYYDDVTPADYEPPFFRGCTDKEAQNSWTKNPLRMEVGNVNSKHFVLSLKVKSVLDPCEDDNVSLGADSMQQDGDSEADSEASISDDEYIVAPIDKQKDKKDDTMVDKDDIQEPAEDEQLIRVRDWIKSYHQESVDITDVLSSFPDISLVLIEEMMDKLVTEGIVVKTGNEIFNISRPRNLEYEFDAVKEETNARLAPSKKTPPTSGDALMYMKALYHALPMNYITVSKLQSKLGGEANQTTVRKLMDKMTREGKRVVHSDLTKEKLVEVQKALDMDAMVEDTNEAHKKSNNSENQAGTNRWDTSTLGGLHSIGSDLTNTKGRSDLHQHGPNISDTIMSRLRENGHNTPTSNTQVLVNFLMIFISGVIGSVYGLFKFENF